MKRTFIRIVLAFCIVICISVSAYAYDGNGTADSPYLISSFSDLLQFSSNSANNSFDGSYFVQTADITVNSENLFSYSGEGFLVPSSSAAAISPISASSTYPFMGNYDGNGYKITGLVCKSSTGASGLFGYIKDAKINNVVIESSAMYGSTYVGGIAGNVLGTSSLSNCSFDGSVILTTSSPSTSVYAGGIAGKVDKASAIIGCTFNGSTDARVSALTVFAGGIAGSNAGTVAICSSDCTVFANSQNYLASSGGITGENLGTMSGCKATGKINAVISEESAEMYAGGITGLNMGTITRAQNACEIDVSGYGKYPVYAGGIAGVNLNGSITVSKNTASFTADGAYVGGIAGLNLADSATASIKDCLTVKAAESAVSSNAGGIVGANAATDNTSSKAQLDACLDLSAENGAVAIGKTEVSGSGVMDISNVYIIDETDPNATTISESELYTLTSIDGFTSDEWIFTNNSFMPDLAVVRNPSEAEVLSIGKNTDANDIAFTVYNPGSSKTVSALISFFDGERLEGTKIVNITMSAGYSAHTYSNELVSSCDSVKVFIFNSTTSLAPSANSIEL